MQNPMGIAGPFRAVGDHDDGHGFPVQLSKQRHDLPAGTGVQVPGGFIGQQDRRAVDHGPGNGPIS